MRTLAVLIALFSMSGCGFLTNDVTGNKIANQRTVTCQMNNFRGFPRSVRGPVVFEFRTTITVAVFNSKKTERVDLTFPKGMCR